MSHARQRRRIARDWDQRMVEWVYAIGYRTGDKNDDATWAAMTTDPFAHRLEACPDKYASHYYDGVDDGANQRIRMEIASIELDAIEAEEKGLDND